MIYLASPYTHDNAFRRIRRYQQAHAYTLKCMQRGEQIFSPIVYGHEFAVKDASVIPFSYWQPFNEHMIRNSAELRVLTIEGWKESRGVQAEISFAFDIGVPVVFAEPGA